jgi:hypothetical protein
MSEELPLAPARGQLSDMHDPKNENDTLKKARQDANDPPETRQPPRHDNVDDGSDVTPRAVAKREVKDRQAEERASEAGGLGTGIGDDRPGGAAPREGEPE